MVGHEVSACTISRWELARLRPYPKTRAVLAQIAMGHGWLDIASALEVSVPFEEWLDLLETNFPDEYADWMTATICILNAHLLDSKGAQWPTPEQVEIAQKYESFVRAARELFDSLVNMHNAATEVVSRPPNERFGDFWYEALKRREQHGN